MHAVQDDEYALLCIAVRICISAQSGKVHTTSWEMLIALTSNWSGGEGAQLHLTGSWTKELLTMAASM